MPPPSAPAPTLPDELLEEIFLRLPPDEPEWLVRASLASKLWLGRLTDPRFHARYSELHGGAAPMLGFFESGPYCVREEEPFFISTTKVPVCVPNPAKRGCYAAYEAWDCRHGRVLLGCMDVSPKKLVILDPITGCRTELHAPDGYNCFGVAVLCAMNGCNHGACYAGPSRVVFVGLQFDDVAAGFVAHAYESLLETGERSKSQSRVRQWSKQCSDLHLGPHAEIWALPPFLIQDTLYFKLITDDADHVGILKYDLCSKGLSLIDVPLAAEYYITVLMGMEDGSLGFAHLDGLTLNLWSRQMGPDGVRSWSQCRVIDLSELFHAPIKRLTLIGSVDDSDIIFVTTELGIYKINLKSLECKKIWKYQTTRIVIPYMRFHYPQVRANPCDAAD